MASWSPQANCGVEVRGLRLATAGAAEMEEVHRRFAEHGVIYFRDVGDDFSPELHMEFAARFGSINVNRFLCAPLPAFSLSPLASRRASSATSDSWRC